MMLKPGAVGGDVSMAQQLLQERGLLPPDAAAEVAAQTYGPFSFGAVKTFQAKHPPLAVDAVLGPATWDALQKAPAPQDAVPVPDYAKMSLMGSSVLHLADTEFQAHVAENPLCSNRGPQVDNYLRGRRGDGAGLLRYQQAQPCAPDGWQGAPWCARFALWCLEGAAAALGIAPVTAGWGDLASSQKWLNAAQAHGRLTDEAKPGRVGCIVTSHDGKSHGHVVLVAGIAADGKLFTREGNSANRVAAHLRSASEFAGFVDLG